MEIRHSFGAASGPSHDDFSVIGYRYAGYGVDDPELTESSVVRMTPRRTDVLLRMAGFLTGIHRFASGRLMATSAAGNVYMNMESEPRYDTWTVHEVGSYLTNVWSLDDDLAFACGRRGDGGLMLRFDGARWDEIPTPGPMLDVHGISRELIYAVGWDGRIARYDGVGFVPVDSPTGAALSSVHVVSEDEMYACGPPGVLLQGSIGGWSERLRAPRPDMQLHAVRPWNGRLWVATGAPGLAVVEGDTLAIVKGNIAATSLDARDMLLIGAPNMVAETRDGASYLAHRIDHFVSIIGQVSPAFER